MTLSSAQLAGQEVMGTNLNTEETNLNTGEHSLAVGCGQNGLARETVESSSFEIVKTQLDTVLL